MTDCEQKDRLANPRRRSWYVWDILLVAGVVLGGGLFPFAVIAYVAGLHNDKSWAFSLSFSWLLIAEPMALICLIVLGVRMVWRWPRCIASRKRLWGFRLFATAGLVAYLVVAFTPPAQNLPCGYMPGFRRYVAKRTDIPAIQAWLNTLTPEVCTGERIIIRKQDEPAVWPDTMNWPESLTHLDPVWGQFQRTEDDRVKIRLWWGTAWATWGAEIGPRDMEIPSTQDRVRHEYGPPGDRQVDYDHGEYRLPLALGAYVWHEIR